MNGLFFQVAAYLYNAFEMHINVTIVSNLVILYIPMMDHKSAKRRSGARTPRPDFCQHPRSCYPLVCVKTDCNRGRHQPFQNSAAYGVASRSPWANAWQVKAAMKLLLQATTTAKAAVCYSKLMAAAIRKTEVLFGRHVPYFGANASRQHALLTFAGGCCAHSTSLTCVQVDL